MGDLYLFLSPSDSSTMSGKRKFTLPSATQTQKQGKKIFNEERLDITNWLDRV